MEKAKREWTYMATLYLTITNPHKNNMLSGYNREEMSTNAFLQNLTPWFIYHKKPEVSFFFFRFQIFYFLK